MDLGSFFCIFKAMRWTALFFLSIILASCNGGQKLESRNGFAVIRAAKPDEAVATYAGGCFWAMQECMIELKGVHNVISGYAGGSKANPTYEEVLAKNTGHAEAVQVYYDPKQISYEQLSRAFFASHDPTQFNRQGPDIGSDYRSIAFYRNEKERRILHQLVEQLLVKNDFTKSIATEIIPFKVIYPAETEHQDYYPKNTWDSYIMNVSKPKVLKLRKEMPEFIKPEYLR